MAASFSPRTTCQSSGQNFRAQLGEQVVIIPVSDETTPLVAGTNKLTLPWPQAYTLTAVGGFATTAPTGQGIIADINLAGVSILSTRITIDAGQQFSVNSATQPVLSTTALPENAVLSFDIDQVGSIIAGSGLKILLYGART